MAQEERQLLCGPETPLICDETGENSASHADPSVERRSINRGTCGFYGGVSNLVVTAIGAGMLSLPYAYKSTGAICGLLLTLAGGWVTYLSATVIVRYSSMRGVESYGALVNADLGKKSFLLLQSSIIVHVYGVMVVYLIIVADILVGDAPQYNGLIPYMLGIHRGGFWISREFVTLVVMVVVCTSMLMAKDLTGVAKASKPSVFLLLYLVLTLVTLSILGYFQGQSGVADARLWPEGNVLSTASALLTAFSVNALAYTCQFNLTSVHNSLRDNRTSSMLQAVKLSTLICALLYILLALAGYLLFGDATEGDVLKNMTIDFASRLLPIGGKQMASIIIGFALAAYTFGLLTNFVLKVWAVRNALCEVTLGREARALSPHGYHILTSTLVGSAYAISVFVPSVYFLVALVGSTACVMFSYVFPALIVIKNRQCTSDVVLGLAAIFLAAFMAISGVTRTLLHSSSGNVL